MTTTDLWTTNLSGGRSLYQHGGLFGAASDVARVLQNFIVAGKATAHPDHAAAVDLESTVSGALLLELLQETEKRTGRARTEEDDGSSVQRVNRDRQYRIQFIEF